MRCRPELTLASDQAFWVSWETFRASFDQADFLCRDQVEVRTAYLQDWFISSGDGETGFLLPTVSIVNDRTQFISGRHRVAVLLPYLSELPIAFAVNHLGRSARGVFAAISKRPLDLSQPILLPDLPIESRLP